MLFLRAGSQPQASSSPDASSAWVRTPRTAPNPLRQGAPCQLSAPKTLCTTANDSGEIKRQSRSLALSKIRHSPGHQNSFWGWGARGQTAALSLGSQGVPACLRVRCLGREEEEEEE